MKILIISDSHGNYRLLNQIVDREAPDHTIHCGDFCTDLALLPKSSLTVVRGNCDHEMIAEENTWKGNEVLFYITHGHKHRVKATYLPIKYRAKEVGAQVVCFGHSHVPFCEKIGEVVLINPGSIQRPRNFSFPTYVCIQLRHKKLKVTYHHTNGKVVPNIGEIYHVKY